MKYSGLIGIIAAIVLIIACFMPWAYYPDLGKNFTGFFSEKNAYGKPGKLILVISILAIILFIVPKVWAKRFNQFVGVIAVTYCFKSFFLFSSCYAGICPEKKPGLFLILLASIMPLIAAVLPNTKIKPRN